MKIVVVPNKFYGDRRACPQVPKDLGLAMSSGGLLNHVDDSAIKPTYEDWMITKDGSLTVDYSANLFGLEIVSPAIYNESRNWKERQRIAR